MCEECMWKYSQRKWKRRRKFKVFQFVDTLFKRAPKKRINIQRISNRTNWKKSIDIPIVNCHSMNKCVQTHKIPSLCISNRHGLHKFQESHSNCATSALLPFVKYISSFCRVLRRLWVNSICIYSLKNSMYKFLETPNAKMAALPFITKIVLTFFSTHFD